MHIQVKQLNFAYSQRPVLTNIEFKLNPGSFLSIVGKNGTGKSTLIKCLLKIVPVPDNTIFFNNLCINTIKQYQHIGYVPQKLDFTTEFPITVNEFLSYAYLKRKDAFFVYTINSLQLNTIYHEDLNNLSGGQLQRVFIARSLLNRPKLLILDEPTVSIDNESIGVLHKILKKLYNEKVTIVLSTHDFEFARELTDYYLALNDKGEFNWFLREDYDDVIKYI